MKKVLSVFAVIITASILTGCATSYPMGSLYTELRLPVVTTDNTIKRNPGTLKVGEAECQSILGLVATGDASIDKAAASKNITKIYYVDWYAKNILGIIGNYKVIVYGE